MRAFVRLLVLGAFVALPSMLADVLALGAATAESERQPAALPAVKGAVLKATGYPILL